MKKFIFIKSKVLNSIDKNLENKFSVKYNAAILTIPAIPFLIHIVNLFVVNYVEYFYPGRGIKRLVFDCRKGGDNSRWIIDKEEYIKLGERVVGDKSFINKVKNDFKKVSQEFYQLISILEKNGINDNKLDKDFFKLVGLYITEYAVNYSVTGPMTLGYGDVLADKLLIKYNHSPHIRNAFQILARPKKDFLSEEHKSLNKIAVLAKKLKLKIGDLANLREQHRVIYGQLQEHQKKYYWITNNYKETKYLGLNYFFQKFKRVYHQLNRRNNISNTKEVRRELKNIYKNIDKKDIVLLKRLGEIAELHDQRKKANLIANYWLLKFLKRISQKTGVSYAVLRLASLYEVLDLLDGRKIYLSKIAKRKKSCLLISLPAKEYWLTGKSYRIFYKRLEKIIFGSGAKNIIKGTVANHGKIKGRVCIVFNVNKEAKKVKNGDILVTSMTRPEFMPLVRKVRAIITDEGGITSHAAIISRELNIPCIVGTKNATSILRDGDLVEVDANKGIVKILKRAGK